MARVVLLLIRHAEQETLRHADPPLSDRGTAQADLLARRLERLPVTAIVASPLRRAQQTARHLADLVDVPVETVDELREIEIDRGHAESSFGAGGHSAAMEPGPGSYRTSALAAVESVTSMRWPSAGPGETGARFTERVHGGFAGVIADHPGGVVACFVHGGVLNSAIGAWLGIAEDLWFVPWHTGVSTVVFTDGRPVLLSLNDASHLAADEELLNVVTRAS